MNFGALDVLQSSLEFDFAVFVFVFFRVGMILMLMPVFGEQVIPVRIRVFIALAFSLAIFPTVGLRLTETFSPFEFFLLAIGEILVGLLFGSLLKFSIFSLQIAGTIAAQSTSLSQLFGGANGSEPQPTMSYILLWGGLALLCTLDAHVYFAKFILHSYEVYSVGSLVAFDEAARSIVMKVSKVFQLAFAFAAPFLVTSLIYNVTLGVINRAMPQLMVAFVGAPAITFGGLFLLFSTSALILISWRDHFYLTPMSLGN